MMNISAPCESKDCGQNSICFEIDNEAICECQSGFIMIDSSCVAEVTCEVDSCDENADCSVVNNVINCNCKEGYGKQDEVCQTFTLEWSTWSDCSATCDGGYQERTRDCSIEGLCSEELIENRECNQNDCRKFFR